MKKLLRHTQISEHIKPTLSICFALTCVLLCGCLLAGCVTNTSLNWIPYRGSQQDWPVNTGTFGQEINGILCYYDYPEKPYTVLATTVSTGRTGKWLAQTAREHGADALIIRSVKSYNLGTVYLPGNSFTYATGGQNWASASTYNSPGVAVPRTETVVVTWAIKFKTQKQARLDDLNKFLEWAQANTNGTPEFPATNGLPEQPAYSAQQIMDAIARRTLERDALILEVSTNSP